MKFLLIISFCLLFTLNVFAQGALPNQNPDVLIEEITMARNESDGTISEATNKFLVTDVPIYCFIQLNSVKPTTVKLILVAVKAEGLKPETKSVSVSYTTNGNQNQVKFNASPENLWASGTYRADIFINGKLARSQTFEIEKPIKGIESITQPSPKSYAPRKTVKKTKKNYLRQKTERLSDIATSLKQRVR